jgi:hypothetical protein
VVYKWRRRFDELALDGLRDRSSRPRVCPNATRTEVVGKIISLRQPYHFGPAKIAMHPHALPRHHHLALRGVAGPQASRPEPAAGFPALQAPRPALEAL